jgi:anthranilate/para-aminobenzoate synthase component I
MIERAQKHIAAGDIYQVCLTNQISIDTETDPLVVFLKLRESNPAPYSAFVRLGSITLVSSSPEQFLRVSADGQISTKPIKGTRPRGDTPDLDQEIADDLRANLKERAENLMIVDLMRNDIGKVSEVGSITVQKLFDIETYATVHQLVSTITGHLAAGQSSWSAVEAAFPGGSMTGAPKIRAMEIIRDLELGPRGVAFESGKATIGVGGGITIDSEPVAELEETKLKAKALLAALNAADPWA